MSAWIAFGNHEHGCAARRAAVIGLGSGSGAPGAKHTARRTSNSDIRIRCLQQTDNECVKHASHTDAEDAQPKYADGATKFTCRNFTSAPNFTSPTFLHSPILQLDDAQSAAFLVAQTHEKEFKILAGRTARGTREATNT